MKLYLFTLLISQNALADLVLPVCYLNRFQIENFPWKMEECLNYEEVFKNSQYDEAKWDEKKQSLIIRHYENGKYQSPQRFIYKDNKLTLVP